MIYLPELDESFDSFDDLLYWFCTDLPHEDDMLSAEAEAFIKHHFPLINLHHFWVTCRTSKEYDAGFIYNELNIDYNRDELRRAYPEYFI